MSAKRVDFYLLEQQEPGAKWLLAARLLEKAYLKGHRVFVHCQTEADALHLDEYLWTFKEDSFIPHHLQGEGPNPPPAIQIGFAARPQGFTDILLNLATPVPEFFLAFQRVIEIVAGDETAKQQGREHFRYYRDQGAKLSTHTIQL